MVFNRYHFNELRYSSLQAFTCMTLMYILIHACLLLLNTMFSFYDNDKYLSKC